MVKYIKLQEIPEMVFAMSVAAEDYKNSFIAQPEGRTFLEITYVSQGTLEIELSDGRKFYAPKNSVICSTHTEDMKLYCKGSHGHHTVEFAFHDCYTNENTEGALCLPFVIHLSEEGRIHRLIDEIIATNTMHSKGPFASTGLFLQLLDAIDRTAKNPKDRNAYYYSRYIKATKNYVYKHLTEPIKQRDIAEHLGVSPEHLCYAFKKSEGIPLMQFINRIKLERILALMENEDFTLARAASLYGYSDPNYVSRLYKKYFGYNITDIKKGRLLYF